MNKKIVELDEDYVVYQEGVNYHNYPKKEQCLSEDGRFAIAGCSILYVENNYSIICLNNKCVYNSSI